MEPQVTSRRAWLALAAMIPAVLIVGLDITVLSVALPTLSRDLNASTSQLQWFVMAYAMTYAAAIIPSGLLGDQVGRRTTLIGSIVVFAVGSLGCALADSAGELIAARAVLGVGAAGIATLSLAVINVLFDESRRGLALRLLMTVNMIGFPLGPILGGWMLGHVAWGWIFVINLPIAALAIPVLLVVMPESRATVRRSWDFPGLLTISASVVALCYGMTDAGSSSWSSASVWLPVLMGIALVAAFVVIESRSQAPIVPLEMFRRPGFTAGASAAAVLSFVIAGVLFFVPQYTQAVLGASTETSGFYLISFAVGMVIGLPLAGKLSLKFGRGLTVVTGVAMLTLALVLAAMTTVHSGGLWLVVWATIGGAAFGLGLPSSMDLALTDLDVDASGVGSAVLQSVRQVATTIGAAVLGSVLSAQYRSALPAADLPSQVVHAMRSGVEAGLVVADELKSPELAESVRSAFVEGVRWSAATSAVLTGAATAVMVIALFVRRRQAPKPTPSENHIGG